MAVSASEGGNPQPDGSESRIDMHLVREAPHSISVGTVARLPRSGRSSAVLEPTSANEDMCLVYLAMYYRCRKRGNTYHLASGLGPHAVAEKRLI